ncbi:hypothetical protein WJX77_004413 [Trebouxia sp. C0004]
MCLPSSTQVVAWGPPPGSESAQATSVSSVQPQVSSYYAQFQAFLAHTTLPSIPVPRNTLLLVRCCHSHGTEGASCQANVVVKCYGWSAGGRQAVSPTSSTPRQAGQQVR